MFPVPIRHDVSVVEPACSLSWQVNRKHSRNRIILNSSGPAANVLFVGLLSAVAASFAEIVTAHRSAGLLLFQSHHLRRIGGRSRRLCGDGRLLSRRRSRGLCLTATLRWTTLSLVILKELIFVLASNLRLRCLHRGTRRRHVYACLVGWSFGAYATCGGRTWCSSSWSPVW